MSDVNIDKRRETLENLKYGDVISWPNQYGERVHYLVVEEVRRGKVRGQLVRPCGVSGLKIEELVQCPDLEIAKWEKLK